MAVPDGVSQLPDVDGVHHAKAFQLVHAQVPVKHLEGNMFMQKHCTAQQLKRTKMQIKIIKLRVVKVDINSLYKVVLASVYDTFLSGTRSKRELPVITKLKGHCLA